MAAFERFVRRKSDKVDDKRPIYDCTPIKWESKGTSKRSQKTQKFPCSWKGYDTGTRLEDVDQEPRSYIEVWAFRPWYSQMAPKVTMSTTETIARPFMIGSTRLILARLSSWSFWKAASELLRKSWSSFGGRVWYVENNYPPTTVPRCWFQNL